MLLRLVLVVGLIYVVAAGMKQNSRTPSGPVLNETTGSYYLAVFAPGIAWDDARRHAERMQHEGRQGHLVTITSDAEEQFLQEHMADRSYLWIGASDSERWGAREGEWRWVTGPEAGTVFFRRSPDTESEGTVENGLYANWADNEPNDEPSSVQHPPQAEQTADKGEDFALWGWMDGTWNDVSDQDVQRWQRGFIVEFSQTRRVDYTRSFRAAHSL